MKCVIITDTYGSIIRNSGDDEKCMHYAGVVSELVTKAVGAVRDLDSSDSLKFLRIRTAKEEIMIAPDTIDGEGKYTLIVVQDPSQN